MDGELEQVEDRWRLRFVRRLPHSPEKVWRAISEPEHLKVSFPTDSEGERATGAALRFVFREGEGPDIEGRMLVYQPPSLLEFSWGGEEVLRFELEPDEDGTRLTFLDTFDELGKASRDAAGWHACLDVLVYHLAGEELPWKPRERWEEVHDIYVHTFPPEASTIGPPKRPSESSENESKQQP
jgi:uncharacterized protein YndB with AHSA1/START domain